VQGTTNAAAQSFAFPPQELVTLGGLRVPPAPFVNTMAAQIVVVTNYGATDVYIRFQSPHICNVQANYPGGVGEVVPGVFSTLQTLIVDPTTFKPATGVYTAGIGTDLHIPPAGTGSPVVVPVYVQCVGVSVLATAVSSFFEVSAYGQPYLIT